MGIITNAIAFIRAGATHDVMEIYTDATSGTVDTQTTAVTSNGKFTAGTFSGVQCKYAISIIGCTVSNTLNNSTTKIQGGTRAAIWGSLSTSAIVESEDLVNTTNVLALTNGANNNVSVTQTYHIIYGPTAGFTITGLDCDVRDGYTVILRNLTGQSMTIANQSASSSVGNKITTLSGADVVLAGNSVVWLIWDAALNGWLELYSDTGTTGTGDMIGPASSTDNAVMRFDGAGGKTAQNSVVTIGDTGAVAGVTSLAMTAALTGVTDITPTGVVTVPNEGLHILDTNASHDLVVKAGSDLTADRIFTITTGDAAVGLDLTGGTLTTSAPATVGGTNTGDQLIGSVVNARFDVAQASTKYASLEHGVGYTPSNTDPTDLANGEIELTWVPSFNGSIRNLYGIVNTAPAAGQTFTVTVVRNTSEGILTATFTDAGVTASDLVNSVSFSAGDRLCWKVVTSATSGSFVGIIAAEIRKD